MKGILVKSGSGSSRDGDTLAAVFDSIREADVSEDVVSFVYMDPPDIILVDFDLLKGAGLRILDQFRSTSIIGHVPVVAVLHGEEADDVLSSGLALDDFVRADDRDLAARLRFIAARAARESDMNPLTRLPGNETIIRTIQSSLDAQKDIAIAWVDLDNFKPYNDRYGFSRGDEVITATARVIKNALVESGDPDCFVGHIGGDDFVFICPPAHARRLCETVVERFDTVIGNFYNDDDLEAGCIASVGRDGVERKYPIMSISIAVVLNTKGRYSHYGEVSRDATDIKKYLKGLEGSAYMIDRRTHRT